MVLEVMHPVSTGGPSKAIPLEHSENTLWPARRRLLLKWLKSILSSAVFPAPAQDAVAGMCMFLCSSRQLMQNSGMVVTWGRGSLVSLMASLFLPLLKSSKLSGVTNFVWVISQIIYEEKS